METGVQTHVDEMMNVRYGTRGPEDGLIFEQAIRNILAYRNPEHIVHLCRAMYDNCEAEDMMETTLMAIDYYTSICDIETVGKYIVRGLPVAVEEGRELARTLIEKFIYIDGGIEAIVRELENGSANVKDLVISIATRISEDVYDTEKKGESLLLQLASL